MEVKVIVDWTNIKIYVSDIPHIRLKKEDLFGIQAWQEGYDKDATYHIEYHLKSGNIISEYWDMEHWKNILKALDEQDLFSL